MTLALWLVLLATLAAGVVIAIRERLGYRPKGISTVSRNGPPAWWWICLAVGISVWALIIYVVAHFVMKYW